MHLLLAALQTAIFQVGSFVKHVLCFCGSKIALEWFTSTTPHLPLCLTHPLILEFFHSVF